MSFSTQIVGILTSSTILIDKDKLKNTFFLVMNVQKLLDFELIIGLHCILPLLELVHMLIKYAQG